MQLQVALVQCSKHLRLIMFFVAKRFVAIDQGNYYFTSDSIFHCCCELESSTNDLHKKWPAFDLYPTPSILKNENQIYCSRTIEFAETSQISSLPPSSLTTPFQEDAKNIWSLYISFCFLQPQPLHQSARLMTWWHA